MFSKYSPKQSLAKTPQEEDPPLKEGPVEESEFEVIHKEDGEQEAEDEEDEDEEDVEEEEEDAEDVEEAQLIVDDEEDEEKEEQEEEESSEAEDDGTHPVRKKNTRHTFIKHIQTI